MPLVPINSSDGDVGGTRGSTQMQMSSGTTSSPEETV